MQRPVAGVLCRNWRSIILCLGAANNDPIAADERSTCSAVIVTLMSESGGRGHFVESPHWLHLFVHTRECQ